MQGKKERKHRRRRTRRRRRRRRRRRWRRWRLRKNSNDTISLVYDVYTLYPLNGRTFFSSSPLSPVVEARISERASSRFDESARGAGKLDYCNKRQVHCSDLFLRQRGRGVRFLYLPRTFLGCNKYAFAVLVSPQQPRFTSPLVGRSTVHPPVYRFPCAADLYSTYSYCAITNRATRK